MSLKLLKNALLQGDIEAAAEAYDAITGENLLSVIKYGETRTPIVPESVVTKPKKKAGRPKKTKQVANKTEGLKGNLFVDNGKDCKDGLDEKLASGIRYERRPPYKPKKIECVQCNSMIEVNSAFVRSEGFRCDKCIRKTRG